MNERDHQRSTEQNLEPGKFAPRRSDALPIAPRATVLVPPSLFASAVRAPNRPATLPRNKPAAAHLRAADLRE